MDFNLHIPANALVGVTLLALLLVLKRKPHPRPSLLVLPTLALNYFGQGALLLVDVKAVENPFYLLAPQWAQLRQLAQAVGMPEPGER